LNKNISDIFNYGSMEVDEIQFFDSSEIKRLTMQRIHKGTKPVRKLSRTLLIAAVIFSLLTVSAFAVGISIHIKRQGDLREKLKIDENDVASYAEYNVSEATGSLTVLSAIHNNDFIEVYANISPITEEQILAWPDKNELFCSVDGGTSWTFVEPIFTLGELDDEDYDKYYNELIGDYSRTVKRSVIHEAILKEYDKETQTLTVRCYIPNSNVDESKPFEIQVQLMEIISSNEVEPLFDYGKAEVSLLPAKARLISFEKPIEFENEINGGWIKLIKLELYPTGLTWYFEHEDAIEVYTPYDNNSAASQGEEWRQLQREWINGISIITDNAEISFSDGSSFRVWSAESGSHENGTVIRNSSWSGTTIDTDAAVSININGRIINFE